MIRKLKRACGIRFSIKALCRNPGVYLRQMTRRFRSFRDLLDEITDQTRITIVQVGANDGSDVLGNLIRDRRDRIERALLIEPQRTAFDRLVERTGKFENVVCLNAAIDVQSGVRVLYSLRPEAGRRLGDGIASFERKHVEYEIRSRMNVRFDCQLESLIKEENVPLLTLKDATTGAGIQVPDVLMVDTESFDAEIVRMALQAGWRPAVIQYEHKHLAQGDRDDITRKLRQCDYCLWADHADVWGRLLDRDPDIG